MERESAPREAVEVVYHLVPDERCPQCGQVRKLPADGGGGRYCVLCRIGWFPSLTLEVWLTGC